MTGIAQKLFLKKEHLAPWKPSTNKNKSDNWPLLQSLLNEGFLSYIDLAVAENLLEPFESGSETAAALLCHLSLATRNGNLCIEISNEINPSISDTWTNINEGSLLLEETAIKLQNLILLGANDLPKELLGAPTETTKKIIKNNSSYYFQKYWSYKTLFAKHLQKIQSSTPKITPDSTSIENNLQQLEKEGKLLPEQAQAIRSAIKNTFSIISGGPGTGKTYTAGLLIKLFWNSLSEEQKQNTHIALAAPTGKAAANLQKSLSKCIQDCEGLDNLKVKTLHSLLNIGGRSSTNNSSTPLLADVILIDESSMIDIKILTKLLESIKPGARLILLGDAHQLPPVEVGSLFPSLVASGNGVTELKTCVRAELKEIITFAHHINTGNTKAVLELLGNEPIKRISFDNEHVPYECQKSLVSWVIDRFPQNISPRTTNEELLNLYSTFRILCPLRKGPLGVDTLNFLIFEALRKKATDSSLFTIPIMITSNNYRQELFNGETGVLIKKDPKSSGLDRGDYALFPEKDGSTIRTIPALLLPSFEQAYCMSVHKSQGSEFDKVFLLLPEGSETFGRELFYTGVTRAKKGLEILGSDATIEKTLLKQNIHLS
jgi:exodeoxyribonuclease V alpha subunit